MTITISLGLFRKAALRFNLHHRNLNIIIIIGVNRFLEFFTGFLTSFQVFKSTSFLILFSIKLNLRLKSVIDSIKQLKNTVMIL